MPPVPAHGIELLAVDKANAAIGGIAIAEDGDQRKEHHAIARRLDRALRRRVP